MNMSRIEIPTWLAVVMATAVVLGAIYSRWKLGSDGAASDAAAAWKGEVEALQVKVERISDDLSEATNARSHLQGQVEQLSSENADLRGLIMGDKVPAALTEAIGAISKATIEADEVRERQRPQVGAPRLPPRSPLGALEAGVVPVPPVESFLDGREVFVFDDLQEPRVDLQVLGHDPLDRGLAIVFVVAILAFAAFQVPVEDASLERAFLIWAALGNLLINVKAPEDPTQVQDMNVEAETATVTEKK